MDTPDLHRRVLAALGLGVFMGALDLTIVAPALPHIGGGLGVSPSTVALAFSIYAVFYAMAVPVMSNLADTRGYKPVYLASLLLFAGGSAGAALAPTLPMLVAARVVQGVGGGGLFPVAQAIVGVTLPKERQHRVLAGLLGIFAVGAVLGPNLGGLLVQHFSWRWIFWINVPLGAVGAVMLTGRTLPGGTPSARFDWAGGGLMALTLGSLILGLERLRHLEETSFFSLRIGAVFLVTIAATVLLVRVERRRADPMLDLDLLKVRAVTPLLGISLLVGYALLGTMIFMPLYMQLRFGATAFGSGAVLNAAAIGLGVASVLAGRYADRFGEARFIQVGMGVLAAGQGVLILFHMHLWGVLSGLALLGAGLGLAQEPISALGLGLAPEAAKGQISGLITITRSLGGAAGITLARVLLHVRVEALGGRISGGSEALNRAVWGSNESLRLLREAPSATQETVRTVLTAGLLDGWYGALGVALAGLALAFLLVHYRQSVASD